jgi:hypothetical protein
MLHSKSVLHVLPNTSLEQTEPEIESVEDSDDEDNNEEREDEKDDDVDGEEDDAGDKDEGYRRSNPMSHSQRPSAHTELVIMFLHSSSSTQGESRVRATHALPSRAE